jgi:hypothetical protein
MPRRLQTIAAIPNMSIRGRRVARELTILIERRGEPPMIISDGDRFHVEYNPRRIGRASRRPGLHRAGLLRPNHANRRIDHDNSNPDRVKVRKQIT